MQFKIPRHIETLSKFCERYNLLEKEEKVDWKKGKCVKCGIDLVVLNDSCQDLEHLKEMKYWPITTPDCLK
jgi:hypothetical protein